MTQTASCGSWGSPLAADLVAAAARGLSQPQLDGEFVYWLEGRPWEGGRQVVVRARPGGAPEDVTPEGVDVRSRVHEYGGGDYRVSRGLLVHLALGEPGFCQVELRGGSRRRRDDRVGTEPSARYADFAISPDRRWVACVEERHREGAEPENRLVVFGLAGGARRVVAEGRDFVSSPRFAPDGRRLAWLAWDHPNMPWDGTELFVAEFAEDGAVRAARAVAGGSEESIFQPCFSPAGRLTFASDRSGWWNLYQEREAGVVPLCARRAEFGRAQWGLGMSTFGFAAEGALVCAVREGGFDRLARLELSDGSLRDLRAPYASIEGIDVAGDRVAFVGAGTERAPSVYRMDLRDGSVEILRSAFDLELPSALLSRPEALTFPSEGGRSAHAFVYRPANPQWRAPSGERPPLLVKSHGGPTSATTAALNLSVQYWTSRGFAVVDVNYGGSSGYGRAFRDVLRGAWGVVDVEDCTNAALHLSREGLVDRTRLAISGGSAGGYTTLCALTFRDVFAAGASRYGIGDLEALARDTHKFESRYLDRLVGPYPERRDLYVGRSPIHFADRLSCPVIFFQGLEDRVVPPNQAEAMVAALARRGIAHAYVAFPGERHGFRRAENIRKALEGELFFYGYVFGFPARVRPDGVEIVGAGLRGS